MKVSHVWSWFNRSSDERLGRAGPEPDAPRPTTDRAPGFEGGFELVSGALIPSSIWSVTSNFKLANEHVT
jgi:hypothetical protein